MKTLTTLIVSLALIAPATAGAAGRGSSAHRTHSITAQVPAGTVPAGFGGPVSTYDATLTPPAGHGCGAARTFAAAPTDGAAGDILTFALTAPHRGWCHGTYRVVVAQHTAAPVSPDSSGPVSPTTTTVLAHTGFRIG